MKASGLFLTEPTFHEIENFGESDLIYQSSDTFYKIFADLTECGLIGVMSCIKLLKSKFQITLVSNTKFRWRRQIN